MILDGHSWAKLLTCSKISQKAVLFKNELLSCDDSASWLLFYYDVNINNPLTDKLHKLSSFYYNLANIKPIYRSKLKSVHLLAICNTSYMKYGINALFSPIMEDFKICGNGYPFQVYGGVLWLRGSLLALLANTPASQLCGGFKEGFGGAFWKCRVCNATCERMQELFIEEDFHLRTHPIWKTACPIETIHFDFKLCLNRLFFSKEYEIVWWATFTKRSRNQCFL